MSTTNSNEMVKVSRDTVPMELTSQYGISKSMQKVLAYSLTYNQLAYMFLTGNNDRTSTKSDYTDELNEMLPFADNTQHDKKHVHGMDNMPSGISRTTRIFKDDRIVVKCDFRAGSTERASIDEVVFYETCPQVVRDRLATLLVVKVGKSGKQMKTNYSNKKIKTRRDDVKENEKKTMRTGRFILSVMVYADDVRNCNNAEVERLDKFLSQFGINDVHVGNVGHVNGKAVCIDYAM